MNTTFILTVLSMIVLGLLLGALINPGIGLLAIPIVLFILLNIVMMSDTLQRQRRIHKMRQFRNSARAQKAGLTSDDKYTVV
jgi:uncharacterized membrane protein YhhN